MRFFGKLSVAGFLALCASPAFALTYAPSAEVPAGRQFADPDAAFDGMASTLRDNVGLGIQGQPLGFGGQGFAAGGYGAERSDGSDPVARYTPERGFHEAPALNPADLYDQEPPFMPTVVGDHQAAGAR